MSDVELTISANVDAAMKEVSGFRKEFSDLVKQVEKPLRQVNTFRELENTLEQTGRKMAETRERVRELGTAMASVEQPTKAMTADYRQAVTELKRLERQEQSQIGRLGTMRRELQASGVDTRNLAAEQRRLAQELAAGLSAGRGDASMTAAKNALGVGAIEQAQRELVVLRQQYQLVTADGTLSGRQRAEAEATYRRSVDSTLTKLRELRQATAQQASKAQVEAATAAAAARQAAEAEVARYDRAKMSLRQFSAEQAKSLMNSRQAAIEAARSDLGVTRARSAEASIKQLNRQYDLLRRSGGLTARELAVAQETLNRKIRETRREMSGIAADQKKAGGGMGVGSVAGVAGAAYGSASALRVYAEITDASKRMDSQLKLATSSQAEFNRVQAELFKIAQNTAAPIEEVVKVYARLSPALDEIGRKNDAINVVDALTKALKINGSTSAETGSVLLQFSQAMGSGVLRGEEFNAIAEAAPPLMRALAKGLGVPTGALRGMAAEGLLTAEIITDLTVKALPELTAAATKLPDTVEGAMTRLRNDVLKAFGDSDSSGLVDAITKLRELLTDPEVVQGLNNLAAGMTTFVGWIITGASEASKLAEELAYVAANANGYIDELTKLEKTLDGVKAARDGGAWIGRPTATLFMTKEQLDSWVKELEGQIEGTQAKIAGLSVDAYRKQQEGASKQIETERQAAEEQEKLDSQKFASFSKYVADVKTKQGEAVKNAEEYLKKQVAAERQAASDLEAAQNTQLETRKRYTEALAGMQGGGDASYSAAQALKLKANQALANKDVEGAKINAQAALQMLQELAQAGENTFGFEGFIKSLQQIEESADQINIDKAKAALDEVKQKGVDLKELLDSVKTTTITVKLDDAALAKARQDIIDLANMAGKPVDLVNTVARPDGAAPSAPVAVTPQLDPAAAAAAQQQAAVLAQTLQRQLVIPVTPVMTDTPAMYQDGNSFSQFPQDGFAFGGYTGHGGKWQPAGVVHAGEHVQPQEVVREPGALAFFERIRRNGFKATMQHLSRSLRGYATGGLVAPRAGPSIPSLSPALAAAASGPNFPDLGQLNLSIGDMSGPVYVAEDFAARLHKAALQRGRTTRR